MRALPGKKLPFRFERVLAVVPLSGTCDQQELVNNYNKTYRSRILATLRVDRLFGVIMTERRLGRILSALVERGYLETSVHEDTVQYRLTASGVQAKLSKKR